MVELHGPEEEDPGGGRRIPFAIPPGTILGPGGVALQRGRYGSIRARDITPELEPYIVPDSAAQPAPPRDSTPARRDAGILQEWLAGLPPGMRNQGHQPGGSNEEEQPSSSTTSSAAGIFRILGADGSLQPLTGQTPATADLLSQVLGMALGDLMAGLSQDESRQQENKNEASPANDPAKKNPPADPPNGPQLVTRDRADHFVS